MHWDEPDEQGERMDYGDDENGANGLEGWEESRELTHEEIWDDSALIEAWNAATEEYEAWHRLFCMHSQL